MDKTTLKPSYYKGKDGQDLFDKFEKGMLSKEEVQGFYAGNIIKYVTRFPKKNGIEDLEKAKTYLDRLIDFESIDSKKSDSIKWILDSNGNIKVSSPTNVTLFIQNQSIFNGLFKLDKNTGKVKLTRSIHEDGLNINKNLNHGFLSDEVLLEIKMYAERCGIATFSKDNIFQAICHIANHKEDCTR